MATKSDATVWLRHRDTGAVRSMTAKQFHADEKSLRAQGYEPCNEDGSPYGS